jgi:hypothetical protein
MRIGMAALVLAATLAAPAAARCPTQDRAVERKLTLGPAPSDTLVSQRIPVCVRHEYRIQLLTGQRLEVSLTSPSGQADMLSILAPSGDRPADGENVWSGEVKESGTYTIEVATDKATRYTLKVSVR